MVELLVGAGADINGRDVMTLSTPLMDACCFANFVVAQALIKKGARLNLKDEDGSTALILCLIDYHDDKDNQDAFKKIIVELIQAGADVNIKNNAHNTALDFALDHEYNEIQDLLIEHGAKTGDQI